VSPICQAEMYVLKKSERAAMSTHRNPHIGTTLGMAMCCQFAWLLAIPMQAQVEPTSSISAP